jgi:hypothetical protein
VSVRPQLPAAVAADVVWDRARTVQEQPVPAVPVEAWDLLSAETPPAVAVQVAAARPAVAEVLPEAVAEPPVEAVHRPAVAALAGAVLVGAVLGVNLDEQPVK